MTEGKPRVLLIGENSQGSSYLTKRLEGRGCDCRFATSYSEACALLQAEHFDLVLSPMRLRNASVFPLMDLLAGSSMSVFYSHAVEEGCWWLPALRRGQRCFGSSALRPSEFVIVLDEVIEEIGLGKPSTLPSSRKEPPSAEPASAKSLALAKSRAAG
jgi:DNA-binding NtrC family response regulator